MVLASVLLAVGVVSIASTEITGKGIVDNGISVVASKDCRMLRIVQGKEVCMDEVKGSVTVLPAPVKHSNINVQNYEQILQQRQQNARPKVDK